MGQVRDWLGISDAPEGAFESQIEFGFVEGEEHSCLFHVTFTTARGDVEI